MVSWYCQIDGVVHGPLSQDEFVRMAEQGRLRPDDLVRNDGKQKWYKAKNVAGLTIKIGGAEAGTGTSSPDSDEDDSSGGASSTASALLKAFDASKRSRTDSPPPNRDFAREEERKWRGKKAALMTPSRQLANSRPWRKSEKVALGVTAFGVLLVILFPPHAPPTRIGYPPGWYVRFVGSPPLVKVDLTKYKKNDVPNYIRRRDDPNIGYGHMPIAIGRILLELLAVAAVGGAFVVIVRVKSQFEPAPKVSARAKKAT